MQSSSSNIVSNNWEEVDSKEIKNLVTETNGKKENILIGKEDVLLHHLDISIVEAEKRINGPLTLKEYYSVYLIETKAIDKNWREGLSPTGSVWRRYSEFELLRFQLENKYPEAIIPPLPEKKASFTRQSQSSDNIDPVFVDRRRVGLENFLLRVAAHPILCHDQVLLKFLQSDREWSDLDVNADGGKYVQQAEFKLKSISTALRLKKPDDHMEEIRHYSSELQSSLGNLLRLRVRLADRLFAIHKLHANYGRVFSEWSALEKTMGDGLQKAGHYMDCYAAAIDAHMEEEDIVADQLKEYLFFGNALQGLSSRHQMAQLEVEKAESHLNLQQYNKSRSLGQDGYLTKLWGKWTGTTETPDDRQAKIETIERNIDEAQVLVQTASTQLSQFSKQAVNEVERFHQHKNANLQESLANYVILQMKLSKMGLQTWKHVKEALEDLP
ncbi:hypothetical protein DAPPUDRAFT_307827 [Daphnia pulex]|uniref:PX domain-containing protein n=1 Tax=Daphnia pulex TaxID=6669 RepID=E9G1K5_DAPPU|nr:hypothetical protein DAPPUDRAFT_307827 [Daphnia pulex]|eukprot:EFX86509.1 hypothetical protein DAPPUDRAFT_307827 [Daphnia pulex]